VRYTESTWALLAVNSGKLGLHGLLTVVVYILFPFAEEP